jgi:hypothetical protein
MTSTKRNISYESGQVNKLRSKQFIQPKLTIGPVNDRYEQEADQIAEQVVQRKIHPDFFFKPVINQISSIQRKCAACEKEEDENVQRKENGNTEDKSNVDSLVADATSGGSPMDNSTRSFMENRFGYDFGSVKIHTDNLATKSAEAINAHAYTTGNDIVFNQGKYVPETLQGKKLLAHELTHVVQQKHATAISSYVQRDSVYEDVASVNPGHAGGIYTGSVDRYEYNDQAAYNARIANNRTNTIYHGNVNVRFDSNTCVLEVPVNVQFVNQTAGVNTTCGDINGNVNDPIRPVSSSAFTSTVSRIMSALPEGLNNWYKVHLGNPQPTGCTISEIPIRVVLTQVAANPDYTIVITGNNGRSYVSGNRMVMCGSDASDSDVIVHEGGHFILGHGDEYHERSAVRPRSRERLGEYSRMTQDAPGRLQAFYERHFHFASEFMNTAFPGCQATLVRGSQGSATEIIPYLQLGGFSTPSDGGLLVSAGVQFGIPLTTMRGLSFMLGPNFNYALGSGFSSGPYNINALMMGIRAGLNARATFGNALGSTWSLNLGIHGEGGLLRNFASTPGALPGGTFTPYAEYGGNLGIQIDSQVFFGAEGARGIISPGGSNPDIPYYRLGFRLGVSF